MTIKGGMGLERFLRGEPNPETHNSRVFVVFNSERGGREPQQWLKHGSFEGMTLVDSNKKGNIYWSQKEDGEVVIRVEARGGEEAEIRVSSEETFKGRVSTDLGDILLLVIPQSNLKNTDKGLRPLLG